MSDIVLNVERVGKAYSSYSSSLARFATWFGLPVRPVSEFWAVRDVSFSLRAGETLALVGQNGAGKSTLLKLITGTVRPSTGTISIVGRVGAILELGLGFNPEFTGRQNVYQAGGLLGYSTEELNALMPGIEDFAELGEFFEQPLRVYSSGMQARLAFSLVTAVRPEILIIDEVLSVGDTYFQHKSFNRIQEFQEQGTTLLIVSHDKGVVQTLCDRAILLENGAIIKDGKPEEIFDFYNAIIAEKENNTVEVKKLEDGRAQTSSGTGEARVKSIGLYNCQGEGVEIVHVGETVELRVRARVYQDLETLVLGYSIKDRLGQVMYGTNTWHTKQVLQSPKAGDEFTFIITFPANLGIGSYSVQIALVDRETHLTANYYWRDLALIFSVINVDKTPFDGCLWNEPRIVIKELVQ